MAACAAACATTPPPPPSLALASPDTALVARFDWATTTARGHVGPDTDPVGPWYEAALPGRHAFCMRDVAHQAIGAELLGLHRQNLNMFRRFVAGIDARRDWCSFWEIDRTGRPAPVDYASDDDFWYNLGANLDLIDASHRLFQWTGDRTYLEDPAFDRFFRLTLHEYVARWVLEPGRIMDRPAFPNRRPGTVRFHTARGIPSYDEAQDEITVGSDLIAMLANGYAAYARILSARGDAGAAAPFLARAAEYRRLLAHAWWDPGTGRHHGFRRPDGTFLPPGTAGGLYLLWHGAVDDPVRIRRELDALRPSHVEILSYAPTLFYRHGEDVRAYEALRALGRDPRRAYPEASFGAVEGIVRGLMGIDPSAVDGRVATLAHLTGATPWAEVAHVPVFSGTITVRHDGLGWTTFTNHGGAPVTWRATFAGGADSLVVDGRPVAAARGTDPLGRVTSHVDVPVAPGARVVVARRGPLPRPPT